MTKAKLITLDGIDGAGKTTQLNVIKEWFTAKKLPVLFTREPGGTPLGEQLRQLLLDPNTEVSLRTEALLMFAAREQHLETVILPALSAGVHVVSDRFTDATFAYQGGGRGLADRQIEILEQWVQKDLQPDLTILLDVPLEVSVERIETNRHKDRFEQEPMVFFQRVRAAYLRRVARYPERYVVVDSNRPKTEVRLAIEASLNHLFLL